MTEFAPASAVTSVSDSELSSGFADAFGPPGPTGTSIAPGRVNLIGDHTDYNGLPVFPMAIQRCTRIAFRARSDNLVRVASLAPGCDTREIALSHSIEPFPLGDWGNYPKAALQALAGRATQLTGFDSMVVSDVPVAAGLSSSSALVVAVANAFLHVNKLVVPPLELAALLGRGERYVGTMGGGMDQAVSLLSREGAASFIQFDPLQLTPVEVPPEWAFVVASSMVTAEKSGDAQKVYNRRTTECHEALERVSLALGRATERSSYRALTEGTGAAELLRVGSAVLDTPLMERFRHVVSEGERVASAVAAMRCGDLAEFGRLMTESHASLRDDYEVSCAGLNRLVDIAVEAGAVGARLTGAGFGGCIVALAARDRATDVMEGLRSRFFRDVPERTIADHLFVARPSAGARVTPA